MTRRFLLSALLCLIPVLGLAGKKETGVKVIPYPSSVEIGKGQFKGAGALFSCENSIDGQSITAIRSFAERIALISGRSSSVAVPAGNLKKAVEEAKVKGFFFLKDESLGKEAYSIKISKKSCIVRASDHNGFIYALETLKQLTDPAIFGEEIDGSQMFYFPCVEISDAPRISDRAIRLDCSRHFWSVEEVKRVLDIMSVYKLNRFFWHLSDDQGWRLEIRQFPKLTEIGAFRNGTMVGQDFNSNDGIRHGGFYTREQVKDIIAYAYERGIDVIPEIELPGHTSAILAAYPILSCAGEGDFEVKTTWGVFDSTICPGKEMTYSFLEGVFNEIVDLFPCDYVSIGTGECPHTEWKDCPDCQSAIRNLDLKGEGDRSAEDLLQDYMVSRLEVFLTSRGRKIASREEVDLEALCGSDKVQPSLWTEHVATPEDLEALLLPQLTALSEILWCNPQSRDEARYQSSLQNESVRIFKEMGYNYKK